MKKLFVSIIAVAALASCAKEELVSVNQEAIEFGGPFVENATRAADKSYSGDKALTAFNLYGTVSSTNGTINIYNGCEVTGSVGTAVWTCPVNQYWIAGASYKFAAVVDADGVTKDGNNMPTALSYVTANQKDLLYDEATATGLASGNGKVNFSFNHLLAKAQFTVKSNTENGYYYSVKNINVNNYVNGTYTIANESWTGTGEKANTAFGNIEMVTKIDTDGLTCENQRLLIPTTADFTVSFTVELWNDNGDAADVMLATQNYTKTVSQDLVKGNAYDFNLSLSVGELIEFTVTSAPTWTNDPTGFDVPLQ